MGSLCARASKRARAIADDLEAIHFAAGRSADIVETKSDLWQAHTRHLYYISAHVCAHQTNPSSKRAACQRPCLDYVGIIGTSRRRLMREDEKGLFLIRNQATRELAPLWPDPSHAHPAWVHQQLGTKSENELQALLHESELSAYLRAGRNAVDARGVFVDIPSGALAWKLKDPFQDARWLFEDSEVVEAMELDPHIVLRVGSTPD